ncbi:MAG: Ig-like domain-containing protein [Dysgonamonadaceae bacterium]|jgi:N-acetylmuramoyl-L-alanine amidase|nr:Ig-like domain-containing protein [Dysgonamonadaceae bacterium]
MKKNIYLIVLLLVLNFLFAGSAVAQNKVTGMSNIKLFLDPGYSGKENQGLYKYSEAEKTLRVAKAIKEYLLTYTDMQEANIKLSREDDNVTVSLTERTDAANAWGADFYYSIHSATGDPSANSTLFMYGGWKVNGVVSEKTPAGGKAFGEIIMPNLTSVLRVSSRGNWADRIYYDSAAQTHSNPSPYLHVNRESRMASLLSEAGFHTNPTQQARNLNDDWKKLEGYAAYQSLVKFLSSQYGTTPANPVQIGIATGFITDTETGLPVNGAKVTIKGEDFYKEYVTDSYASLFYNYSTKPNEIHNGFYFMEGLTPGITYEVTAEASGFQKQQAQLTIPATIGATTIDGLGVLDIQLLNEKPAVVSAAEPSNTTNVSLEKPIILTFSRKMDRASVESALSLSPTDPVTCSWSNDYTLQINISKLAFQTNYTLTIDATVAKNAATNDFLDGDNDGWQGGNYVMTFKTAAQDLIPPTVVSYDPANASQPEVLRPIVRIQFSEPLDEASIAPNQITVLDDNNETVGGKQEYTAVNNVGVLHYFFSADLIAGKTYTVKMTKGALADRYGNAVDLPTAGLEYSFTLRPRKISLVTVIDDFESGTGGWPTYPKAHSETTTGVNEDITRVSASSLTALAESAQSMILDYQWTQDPGSKVIQLTKTDASPTFVQAADNTLQAYIFGDASGSQLRFSIRQGTTGTIWSCRPITIDWAGWKLVSWKPGVAGDGETWLTGSGPIPDDTQVNFACFGLHGAANPNYQPSFIVFDNMQVVKIGNPLPTSLSEVKADEISVTTGDKTIQITASQTINDIRIYSIGGELVKSAQPEQSSYQIPTGDWTQGVYIVKVATGTAQKNVKILIK